MLFRSLELELENNKLEVELETEDGNETELEAPLPHSKRADEDQTGKPVWAAPFVGLTLSDTWWTPVRESLLSYLRLPSEAPPSLFLSNTHSNNKSNINSDGNNANTHTLQRLQKPILTYISMQSEPLSTRTTSPCCVVYTSWRWMVCLEVLIW